MQKTYRLLIVTLLLIAISVPLIAVPALSNSTDKYTDIKNVIMLVPDGCSQSIQTIARWYKGSDLNVDALVTGTLETWMANSVITDSAPASTAFATGHKSTDKFIGVGPRTSDLLTGYTPTAEPYVPLATVLEAAKLAGKATGLIATSTISHATPAGFAAHNHNRGDEADITEQMVYNDVDVVLGGGAANLFPKNYTYTTSFGATWTGSRADGENLYQALLDRGYSYVDSKTGMNQVSSGKVWGLFAPSSMQPEVDRATTAPSEPTLAEMTTKALQLLSKDKDGFFLMIEGSQVDWADHANDPIYTVEDFLAFDDAVGVALNFAKNDGHTLLLAFPDHNCGGLSLGSYYQDTNTIKHGYTATTIQDVVSPLQKMDISAAALAAKLSGITDSAQMANVINQYWHFNLTASDVNAIKAIMAGNSTGAGQPAKAATSLDYAISEYVCAKYTVFGWTTHGHTGDDVPLWAWAPKNTPVGHYDNTDMAKIVADALNVNLEAAQTELYVDVSSVYATGEWWLNTTDPANPVLVITHDGKNATLPISKDTITITTSRGYTRTYNLEGLTVRAPMISSSQVFISQEAVDLLD
jgi:alkaline phosphatase